MSDLFESPGSRNEAILQNMLGDADNTMILEIIGLPESLTSGSHHYLRLCGLGSGANIDLRINENFT